MTYDDMTDLHIPRRFFNVKHPPGGGLNHGLQHSFPDTADLPNWSIVLEGGEMVYGTWRRIGSYGR